ncbi:glycosyl transferase, WecB/TagA/CpsF family protein [Nostoc sp. HK-01]|nr:glycosyl transferase, WecB/TagA/CpsF family protein [Nostoc sp. HK-01]
MKVNITGVQIDKYSFEEVVDIIVDYVLSDGSPRYVVTPNAQHVLTLQKDVHFQNIYSNAFLVVPDGVPLLWAARFLQKPLKGRVNGTDLFEKLCEVSASKGLRLFLLGGRPEAAKKVAEILQARHPDLKIVGTHCPPYGFESNAAELALINCKIKEAAPHILFVGLGAPKQEKWIYSNYQQLNVPISIGIGVSFELVAGMVQRAPVWMQKSGLEWLFRLMVEPKRLWQRYIVGNPLFIWLVVKQKLRLDKF